jgi:hypothetical protein
MAELTDNETQWIKAAASAFLAIRVATQSPPDGDQIRDIYFLADALHNIGMAGTGKGAVDQMRVWLIIVTSIIAVCALAGTVLGVVNQITK